YHASMSRLIERALARLKRCSPRCSVRLQADFAGPAQAGHDVKMTCARPPSRCKIAHALAALAAVAVLSPTLASAPPDDFDELYAKGKKVNDAMKTLTARFTETTTSTLLTKPLVARGRVAVERPSRVVLRYTEPDARTVLIDGNTMTMVWPSRNLYQVTDISTTQGRIQRYFVNGT